ncbi:MAG TPA: transcriptional regulator [Vicinamibacteria bacterium]|nr:transcriptional regulator [Vicinamibacteria bacterium]
MPAIVFFIELLLWLLILRVVLRGLARMFGGGPAASRPPSPQPPQVVEDLVLDRVCHTYVPRSQAVLAHVAGRELAFCSTSCRDKALSAIARAS